MRHKHADIIKAWADGAIIQILTSPPNEWSDCKHNKPEFHPSSVYRVKPEPFAWLEGQEFYEVCQQYRHAKDLDNNLTSASDAFEQLKTFIRINVEKF